MNHALYIERIQSSLVRLKLQRMTEILESVAKTAEEQGKSYLSFLNELLEEEVASKE